MEKINKKTLAKIKSEGGLWIKKIKSGWFIKYIITENNIIKTFGGKYKEYCNQYITSYYS